MNFLKKKIQIFCISNIMVSLISTNFVNVTYTKLSKEGTSQEKVSVLKAEELEPVSQKGNEEEKVIVPEVKTENVVVPKEVTRSIAYVPARYSEVTGQAVVDYAKRYLGLRYVSGGYSLSTGTDCSGFTKLIFSEFGVYLPRTVSGQMYSGSYVRKDDLRKGDIVIYGNGGGYATHVGIYIGDSLVLHESNHRDGVKISTLYMMQYITARRVINDTAINIVEQQIEETKKEEEENTENKDDTTLNTDEENITKDDSDKTNIEKEDSSSTNTEGKTDTTDTNTKETPEVTPSTEGNTSEEKTDTTPKEEPKEETKVEPKEEPIVPAETPKVEDKEALPQPEETKKVEVSAPKEEPKIETSEESKKE